MREKEYEEFLRADDAIKSKTKTIASRVSKARQIERELSVSLDEVIENDCATYELLLRIKCEMKDTNGNVSNALRKYYEFSNGRRFPPLAEYKKAEEVAR